LLGQVLDFRKLDANLFTMTRRPVEVRSLIDSACKHCRAFLLPSVGLKYRVVPPGAVVMLDARRIHQIITNGLR
jgi:signal transduction histidine kinase